MLEVVGYYSEKKSYKTPCLIRTSGIDVLVPSLKSKYKCPGLPYRIHNMHRYYECIQYTYCMCTCVYVYIHTIVCTHTMQIIGCFANTGARNCLASELETHCSCWCHV